MPNVRNVFKIILILNQARLNYALFLFSILYSTTWNPTPKDSPKIVDGPVDYAAKHWSGLIMDYYARRASILLGQSLDDAAAKRDLNHTEVARLFAKHAYDWTVSTKPYPMTVIGNAFDVSIVIHDKYRSWFTTCSNGEGKRENVATS
jgi:hypothetical protein